MQDDTNQTQQPHPPKLLHIPSLWVDTLRNSILYGMYLYVLQPPKYSMVPPPQASQVSCLPPPKYQLNRVSSQSKSKLSGV